MQLYHDKLERCAFWAVCAFLTFCAAMVIQESYWRTGSGPGIGVIPKPENSSATFYMMNMYTAQMAIAVCAVLQKRLNFNIIFITIVCLMPTIYVYRELAGSLGSGAPAVQFDEFARIVVGGISGALLIMPWLVRKSIWPARSPGHLAIGIATAAISVLQVIFHLALVVPASELSFSHAEIVKEQVLLTKSPDELMRLHDIGVLDITPLKDVMMLDDIVSAGAINPESVAASAARIMVEAPGALHVWNVAGESKIDRNLMIYDGRGIMPKVYLAGTRNFMLPRLTAISAYYFLAAFSTLVWMLGALFIHASHKRMRTYKEQGRLQ